MGIAKQKPIDYRLRLQNLVRTGNRTVHALKSVLDMLGDPAHREVVEAMLKSHTDALRNQLRQSSPQIEEVAQEYLHPRGDMWLEFGIHDLNNAYLNYNVPITSALNEPAIIDIANVLSETAAEIVRDANEYEDLDDYDPREWITASEPTWFDCAGNEIEGYNLDRLDEVRTIQLAIMRKDQ